MPRPEYKDPEKKTFYIEKVDPEVLGRFLDICYKLDKTRQDAFPILVNYYYEKEKVKPRPSRRKS